ncbi:hypothetical protein EG329_005313 [Mollisiaceae sp. DMI_Dod_QoI]|nr:hypothetical protein EG329_005313 [Helotiales sp. DMI_Dod_QoI]
MPPNPFCCYGAIPLSVQHLNQILPPNATHSPLARDTPGPFVTSFILFVLSRPITLHPAKILPNFGPETEAQAAFVAQITTAGQPTSTSQSGTASQITPVSQCSPNSPPVPTSQPEAASQNPSKAMQKVQHTIPTSNSDSHPYHNHNAIPETKFTPSKEHAPSTSALSTDISSDYIYIPSSSLPSSAPLPEYSSRHFAILELKCAYLRTGLGEEKTDDNTRYFAALEKRGGKEESKVKGRCWAEITEQQAEESLKRQNGKWWEDRVSKDWRRMGTELEVEEEVKGVERYWSCTKQFKDVKAYDSIAISNK